MRIHIGIIAAITTPCLAQGPPSLRIGNQQVTGDRIETIDGTSHLVREGKNGGRILISQSPQKPLPTPAICDCNSVGLVIGTLPDPLAAYASWLPQAYPNGIPVTEAGFARWVLRGGTVRRLIGPPILAPPLFPLGPDRRFLPIKP